MRTTVPERPQVNGVVLKRLFIEGCDVKEGQQLYQIDPATYQASYDSAAAFLGCARCGTHAHGGGGGALRIERPGRRRAGEVSPRLAAAGARRRSLMSCPADGVAPARPQSPERFGRD